jgi:hypothetical protein
MMSSIATSKTGLRRVEDRFDFANEFSVRREPAQSRGWAMVSRAILNLDETITKE